MLHRKCIENAKAEQIKFSHGFINNKGLKTKYF